MTRKDYVLIAAALLTQRPGRESYTMSQWLCDVQVICNALAQDNPRFDRERFLKACGVQS